MKNIYKLLEEIETDDNEMKEIEDSIIEVSEFEKEQVKEIMKKRLNRNGNLFAKGIAVAAIAGMFLVGTIGIGVVNPSYAAEIPIVGDIFRFLDHGRTGAYDRYQEFASEVNVTKESGGIQITIKDAIFDGRSIYYTYEVKTNQDLGEHPYLGMESKLRVKRYKGGMSGSSQTQKIDEHTYIGQDRHTLDQSYEKITCKLELKNILIAETQREEVIKGSWKFDLNLDAVIAKDVKINQSVRKDEFAVTIDKLSQMPMSFLIVYRQQVPEVYRTEWDNVTTTLLVEDDLGNTYVGECNGGSGNMNTGIMNFSMTFGKLDEKAKELMITPEIDCSTNKGGVAFDENGQEIQIKPSVGKEPKKISFEPIHIKLK